MPRPAKTQWDFGELFPAAETRRVFSVSELTAQIKRVLEQHLGSVWVSGEVTNRRAQASGHLYFTIKDGGAQLNCVLFRGEARVNRDLVIDGQKVLLQGQLTVYEPRGQYQLRVTAVELQGIGALQLRFDRLKAKLLAEGLFASERKRPLPRYPQRVGLVTSPTGAALRDVLHVVQRRHPALELVLAPCRVQGQGAAEEIAASIQWLNEWSTSGGPARAGARPARRLDLILLTRGGGSLEDLWAFNEEVVARAICSSALPIVSAVGHEIDFTISDFVADFRAATPSVAAEIITEAAYASRSFLAEAPARLGQLAWRHHSLAAENLAQLAQRLARAHPRRQLDERWQHLDDLESALLRSARFSLKSAQGQWNATRSRWAALRLEAVLNRKASSLAERRRRLADLARRHAQACRGRWDTLAARLHLLSPEHVLARGYSITSDALTGKVIRAASETRPGQSLRTRVHRGEIASTVDAKQRPS